MLMNKKLKVSKQLVYIDFVWINIKKKKPQVFFQFIGILLSILKIVYPVIAECFERI